MLWLFMLLSNLLVPVTMLIAGWIMRKHCPKEINAILGYRTKMSMINKDTWEFAHDHCGRLWFRIGLVTVLLTIIAQLPFLNSSKDAVCNAGLVVAVVNMIVLFVSVIPTHLALKKTFNEDGTRK